MSNDIENEVAKIQAAKMRYQGLMVLQWLQGKAPKTLQGMFQQAIF